MKSRNIVLWLLLIAGLVLSSIIRFKINLGGEIIDTNIWITLPLPLFDYGGSSPIDYQTTTFIGYIFYVAFGLTFLIVKKHRLTIMLIVCGLVLLSIIGSIVEISCLSQGIDNTFQGRHLRFGPSLFLLGLYVIIQSKRQLKQL